MPPDLLSGEAFPVFLVFARLGAALMLAPGFGEHHVLPRLRLLLALASSLVVSPALAGALPPLPAEPWQLATLVSREILVGLFLGFTARLVLAAVHVGGSLIATQSGLSAAALFDPNEAAQSTLPASFLTAAALALLFAADFHHLVLRALVASYAILPIAGGLDGKAAGELSIRLVADATATGVRIAAPMIAAGFVVNLGLGALNRMVPAFPVLMLALPLQLLLALAILEQSLPPAMELFGQSLVHGVAWLDRGG
ncbi:flagellar biosynthetic protein FliR [Benzoatithermus flavus]|uniref:Flagellar biosynthetic protein FliR n=1 Tax=Benzoatithermus flavus TaxID=3108223 RepID=A0ABU8XXW9_9PROT